MSSYSHTRGEIGHCYLPFISKGIYKMHGGTVHKADF